MDDICNRLCGVCLPDLHTGQNRHRRRQFQSCNGNPNRRRRNHVLGYGIHNQYPRRHLPHQQKKLAIPDFIGSRHRCFLALLLSRIADRRSFQSGSYRQAEYCSYLNPCICISAGKLYHKISHRLYPDYHWHSDHGIVKGKGTPGLCASTMPGVPFIFSRRSLLWRTYWNTTSL